MVRNSFVRHMYNYSALEPPDEKMNRREASVWFFISSLKNRSLVS